MYALNVAKEGSYLIRTEMLTHSKQAGPSSTGPGGTNIRLGRHELEDNTPLRERLLLLEQELANRTQELADRTQELQQRQNDLQQSQNDLQQSQNDLQQFRDNLQQCRDNLQQRRNNLRQCQIDLQQSREEINMMKRWLVGIVSAAFIVLVATVVPLGVFYGKAKNHCLTNATLRTSTWSAADAVPVTDSKLGAAAILLGNMFAPPSPVGPESKVVYNGDNGKICVRVKTESS